MMNRSYWYIPTGLYIEGGRFPHLMFHIPKTDGASWGNLDGPPVAMDPRNVPEPETTFFVPVGTWSDGTPAPAM